MMWCRAPVIQQINYWVQLEVKNVESQTQCYTTHCEGLPSKMPHWEGCVSATYCKRCVFYLLPLGIVLQNAGSVVDGPEVFTDGQVGSLVLVHLNHQVVILQLQLLVNKETKQ